MADPLSITASIAGLLSASYQIYTVLDTYIAAVKDAPYLARTLHAEVNSFKTSLSSFQAILVKRTYGEHRGELIPAENIIVSVMDAMLLLSQLESEIRPIATTFTLWEKSQWARKRTQLLELVTRLQWQKTTLILQLNILQCSSDQDARRDSERYCKCICDKIARDRDLESRLELLESQMLQAGTASMHRARSILPTDDIDSDNGDDGDDDDSSEIGTIRGKAQHQDEAIKNLESTRPDALREFEHLLLASWVYRRNVGREEDMSFHSSVIRESAYSILSQLSLADISVISVIALPIQLRELSNGYCYKQGLHSRGYTLAQLEGLGEAFESHFGALLAENISDPATAELETKSIHTPSTNAFSFVNQDQNSSVEAGQPADPEPFRTKRPPDDEHNEDRVTTFKSFRVAIDDPCRVVLPVALQRYQINDDWRKYALYIVHGDQERCLGLDEKPLLMFKQLDREGRKPMFMLRRHASPQEGWSSVTGDGSI